MQRQVLDEAVVLARGRVLAQPAGEGGELAQGAPHQLSGENAGVNGLKRSRAVHNLNSAQSSLLSNSGLPSSLWQTQPASRRPTARGSRALTLHLGSAGMGNLPGKKHLAVWP